MSSELKLVVENEAGGGLQRPDVGSLNPMDALNRRDIELIKKSLVGMHRDGAELRTTMVALHERNSRTPSKSFFVTMAVVWFVGIGALAVARPNIDAAFRHVPMLARLSSDVTPR